jgi:hypothetical protein
VDVTSRLLGLTRPHPLVLAGPGATRARLGLERALRERGWPAAATPAEADLVVVCGSAGHALAAAFDELWQQVPNPRARVHVEAHPTEGEIAAALEAGRMGLMDADSQRADAVARATTTAPSDAGEDGGEQDPHAGHEGHGEQAERHSGGADEGDHGMPGHQDPHAGHGGHGGMSMPAGLAMADRAPDRDGLKLDQLHVPLGPVLPHWPTGLVLHVALQGDVVQEARVEVLADGREGSLPFWDEPWLRALAGERVPRGVAARHRAAAHLDSLMRLLDVAGWSAAALAAQRLPDDLLAGLDRAGVAVRFTRFARRVRGSRTLRWLTDGLGPLPQDRAIAKGVSGPARRAGGDVTARWWRWLVETAAALDEVGSDEVLVVSRGDRLKGPRGSLGQDRSPSRALLDLLPDLLTGAELAAVRLIVASLDPDLDQVARRPAVDAAHG